MLNMPHAPTSQIFWCVKATGGNHVGILELRPILMRVWTYFSHLPSRLRSAPVWITASRK